jgi:hypothetical protein
MLVFLTEIIMNYAYEVCSRANIYVHNKFHKDWFRHSKVYNSIQTTKLSHKSFFTFSKLEHWVKMGLYNVL